MWIVDSKVWLQVKAVIVNHDFEPCEIKFGKEFKDLFKRMSGETEG